MARRRHSYNEDCDVEFNDDNLNWMYDVMFDEDCDPDDDMSGEAIFGD